MKKLLLSLVFLMAYVMPSNAEVTKSFGATITGATIDSTVKDDVDSNGTTDTTKELSNDVAYGSLFFEVTNDSFGPGEITLGLDLIAGDAEFDSRSTSQSSTKAKAAGAAPQTSGTNKGTVDVSRHLTLYVQPGFTTSGGLTVFGTLGLVRADADAIVESVSSTNKTVEESLNGTKVGLGIKKSMGDIFFKIEYAQTDYDDISVTTGNNTKVTADIDNTTLGLSIGKSF